MIYILHAVARNSSLSPSLQHMISNALSPARCLAIHLASFETLAGAQTTLVQIAQAKRSGLLFREQAITAARLLIWSRLEVSPMGAGNRAFRRAPKPARISHFSIACHESELAMFDKKNLNYHD